MMEYVHGGDIYAAQKRIRGPVLDFSANINPLGIPQGVRDVIARAGDACAHYPDPFCRALTRAVAQYEQVQAQYVLCGNGAADLIFRLAQAAAPRRALITAPTFAEYEQALKSVGCEVRHHILHARDAYCVTDAFLSELSPSLDIVFLCNPNNPTGQTIPAALLSRILELCAQYRILVALDECFVDFLDDPAAHTRAGELARYENLIIFKAFTKLYAMPGIRLGYCLCADTGLLGRMCECAQPWSVSVIAQLAGVQALQETQYRQRTASLIREERAFLRQALTDLGCIVYGSNANFVFFRAPGQTQLREKLERAGILIRSCANFRGLGAEEYRVAVRAHGENVQLVNALKAAVCYNSGGGREY